jgi:two-component system CheB/CheR fusion protein
MEENMAALQRRTTIVAVGASAGGLEAFRALLDALPADPGLAFVFIQHPDPPHAGMLVELLRGHTRMGVQQAANGMTVMRDNVYIVPPGLQFSLEHGLLRPARPSRGDEAGRPFDFFLRSLAAERGDQAICVVLSGTGSDGSLGIRTIRERGGLVLVQSPDEATYDGMVRSAMATGAVDHVLPVQGIVEILTVRANAARDDAPVDGLSDSDWPAAVVNLIRSHTAYDFCFYKSGTVQRQIDRRMTRLGIQDRRTYLAKLAEDHAELELLAKELLINVTRFFRDAETFDHLSEKVIPDLIGGHPADQPLRVWVAGCSSGEETYSLAIILMEAIAALQRPVALQIFGTDVDVDAVALAREGLYPKSIEADVSPERLARFFVAEKRGYRVRPELRAAVVLTVQDLLADPPFSRLDFVSCRNLLIYLRPEAQRRVLSVFRFALRDGGILLLGPSETVAGFEDRFEPLSKTARIYRAIGSGRLDEAYFAGDSGMRRLVHSLAPHTDTVARSNTRRALAQAQLLEAFAPPSVLIDQAGECLYFFGATEKYLALSAGEASRDLLVLARPELRYSLRAAIGEARRTGARAVSATTRTIGEAEFARTRIDVQPLLHQHEALLLVSFFDDPAPASVKQDAAVDTQAGASAPSDLERELEAMRRELERAVRDVATANEAHKQLLEEVMAVNQEFQSTDEELVTSKEELQSLNEELITLNSRLQEALKREQQTRNDLQNILDSTGITTLFLDTNLTIRFFTLGATALFPVLATDIGRPLTDLAFHAPDPALLADARAVVEGAAARIQEIEAQAGTCYIRRIQPYRTSDGRVEGVVVTFADITEIKRAEQKTRAARAYAESVINTVGQPLVVLDEEARIVSANRAFYTMFDGRPDMAVGCLFSEIADKTGDGKGLRALLARVAAAETPAANHLLTAELPVIGRCSLLLSAHTLAAEAPSKGRVLLTINDITEREVAAAAIDAAREVAERASAAKSRFLAAASHDLRQPLQTLSIVQALLAQSVGEHDTARLLVRLEQTIEAMKRMLDTLLDINQLDAGIVAPEIVSFSLASVFDQLHAEYSMHAAANGLEFRVIPSRLRVRSDPRLLEHILRNLLSNAVKYTRNGRLLLGCRRIGDHVRIEVWDTGIGLSTEEISIIFEEFQQLDNPARDRTKGLGLGLSIVRRVAELLGHPIAVKSTPGMGSVFSVEVPVALERSSEPEMLHDGPGQAAVLIVEDDSELREMLGLLLASNGYHVTLAADGSESVSLVRCGAVRPDIIVADYNLPNGPSGLEAVKMLHAELDSDTPAIILSGDIATETLRVIAESGHAHLAKPVKPTELTDLMDKLLDDWRGANRAHASAPTVYVIDDDPELREAIRAFLTEHGHRVETWKSGEAFLDRNDFRDDGCLIVDVRLPGMSGIELVERVSRRAPRLSAIVITGHSDVATAVEAMKRGAIDFVEKPVDPQVLLASVERALRQHGPPALRSHVQETALARLARLSSRERQILDRVLAGQPSKNIAADLGLSQRTVESHRAAIMRKTGSASLPELIRVALAAQL